MNAYDFSQLWDSLERAQGTLESLRRYGTGGDATECYQQGRRDALIGVIGLLTGQTAEEVYEQLFERLAS